MNRVFPVLVTTSLFLGAGNAMPNSKAVAGENVKQPGLTAEQIKRIDMEAAAFFKANAVPGKTDGTWKFEAPVDQWLAGNEADVRQTVWKAYRAAPFHETMKKDFDEKKVRSTTAGKDYVSAYTLKKVGKRPEKGWPLVIAMHGGGNAPKAVNDQQWNQMQIYYKDQPSVTGYQYLALRAPNDTWNGFYDDYVPPLIDKLIRQFLIFGDVDPDKVYLIGYSHGGYGAFYIGPKMPDHFAAIHASASAPTDNTISPLTLRNTRFTFMVGDMDTAYGRRERCEKFDALIEKLKADNRGEFPVEFELKKGYGHGGLPDRDKIKDLYPYTRNATPRHLSWELTDSVLHDFFWLHVAEPKRGQSIDAVLRDDKLEIASKDVEKFMVGLDSRLITFEKPLSLVLNGKSQELKLRPSFLTLCQSMLERGDPERAFTCRVELEGKKK